jgi:antitoxin component YwqK of YwqJK toxin-antitoxin module
MKKLLTILCLVLLVSCSNEVPSHRLIENGGVTFEIDSNDPFTGVSTEYHENGQPEEKTYYKNGKKVSKTRFDYYENGQLISIENYKNELLEGLHEDFYENGKLMTRGNYKDGKIDGLWEYFDEEGNLIGTKEYKWKEIPSDQLVEREGIRYEFNSQTPFTGSSVDYRDNGQGFWKQNYKDGKLNGLREFFDEDGQLNWRENYKDGKLNGLGGFFDEDGSFLMSFCYKNGETVDDVYCED